MWSREFSDFWGWKSRVGEFDSLTILGTQKICVGSHLAKSTTIYFAFDSAIKCEGLLRLLVILCFWQYSANAHWLSGLVSAFATGLNLLPRVRFVLGAAWIFSLRKMA